MKKLIFTLTMLFAIIIANAQSVIVVNDDNVNSLEYNTLVTAVASAGYTVDTFNFVFDTTALSYEKLQGNAMVIWYIGNDRVALNLWDTTAGPDNPKFHPALQQYYDNKDGAILIDGLDIVLPLIKQTDGSAEDFDVTKPYTFAEGTFVHDVLGIASWDYESYTDDGETGVAEMDVADGNTIINLLNPITWKWSSLWRADGWTVVADAYPLYVMGPSSYGGAGKVSFFKYVNNDVKLYVSSVRMAVIGDGSDIVQSNINMLIANILGDAFAANVQSNTQNLTVYPNPATDFVFVNASENAKIILTSTDGKKIGTFNSGKINISELNPGLYILTVIDGNNTYSQKILKK